MPEYLLFTHGEDGQKNVIQRGELTEGAPIHLDMGGVNAELKQQGNSTHLISNGQVLEIAPGSLIVGPKRSLIISDTKT